MLAPQLEKVRLVNESLEALMNAIANRETHTNLDAGLVISEPTTFSGEPSKVKFCRFLTVRNASASKFSKWSPLKTTSMVLEENTASAMVALWRSSERVWQRSSGTSGGQGESGVGLIYHTAISWPKAVAKMATVKATICNTILDIDPQSAAPPIFCIMRMRVMCFDRALILSVIKKSVTVQLCLGFVFFPAHVPLTMSNPISSTNRDTITN